MTRKELAEILLPTIARVESIDIKTAERVIQEKTTTELSLLYTKYLNEGHLRPLAPAVTHEDVSRELARGAQELEDLRQQHRENLAAQQAERNADWWLHQRQKEQAEAPQRAAQLVRDKKVFLEAYQTLRSFKNDAANWNIVSSTLGPGFTVYDVQQAVASNAIQLSKPGQAEIDQWAQDDIERHNERLMSMSVPELKQEVRREQAERAQQAQQQEADRTLRAQQQADSYQNFPEMPLTEHGQKLDGMFFRRASASVIRNYARRFGVAQINNAIRNRQ